MLARRGLLKLAMYGVFIVLTVCTNFFMNSKREKNRGEERRKKVYDTSGGHLVKW
jgi:hypothetical protein